MVVMAVNMTGRNRTINRQKFDRATLQASLRREELRFTGAFERVELPIAIAALLLVTLLAVFNIFELKQVMLRDADVDAGRRSANAFMLPDPRIRYPGNLRPVPEAGGAPAHLQYPVAKARVELACPRGHDVLSVARIPVPPLGYVQ